MCGFAKGNHQLCETKNIKIIQKENITKINKKQKNDKLAKIIKKKHKNN